jgi:hypothetical protein
MFAKIGDLISNTTCSEKKIPLKMYKYLVAFLGV